MNILTKSLKRDLLFTNSRRFASQVQPPEFLSHYSKLFDDSKTLENIMPRKFENGDEI